MSERNRKEKIGTSVDNLYEVELELHKWEFQSQN